MAGDINTPSRQDCDKAPMTREAVFLELMKFFAGNKADCCVLGDTRGFPKEIRSDVDIALSREAFSQLSELLSQFCTRHNLLLVQMLEHELTARYYALAWRGEGHHVCFLNPDVCSDFYHIGRFYVPVEELLTNRSAAVDTDGAALGFYVAAPATDFIYYLIKKIDKLDLSERSGAHLTAQWLRDPVGARKNIQRFWPDADARFIASAAENNSWQPVIGRMRDLQQSLRRHRPFCAKTAVRELLRKLRRGLNPTGLMVAFFGPDGSGKSSVIDKTLDCLGPAFRRTMKLHLRPDLVKKPESKTVIDPHAREPYGQIVSFIKLVYLWTVYFAGYFRKIYPRLACSTLVLFDRYYDDLLVDTRRYRYGGPRWAIALVGRMIPRPDLCLLLDAPVNVLRQRKQEVTEEETSRQAAEYHELAKTFRPGAVVDASKPLDEVVFQVNMAILTRLAERVRRRLRL